MNIFVAAFLSFLPKKYRDVFTRFEVPPAGAVLSGVFQSFVCLYLLVHGYFAYANERMASMSQAVLMKASEKGGESALMGFGSIFMLEYLAHLSTILLLVFLLEGIVRMIAAIASREVVPTFPLKIAAVLQSKLENQSKERRMGERIRDEVVSSEGSDLIRIASCRPKPWTKLTTIHWDGAFLEMAAEEKGTAPRPFVYILRRKPLTAVMRSIYAYDPDEVLHGAAR